MCIIIIENADLALPGQLVYCLLFAASKPLVSSMSDQTHVSKRLFSTVIAHQEQFRVLRTVAALLSTLLVSIVLIIVS
jgi:hypothetical protein